MIDADEFNLAAAIRAAGLAEGVAAIELACYLIYRAESPTLVMRCEAELERRALGAALDAYVAELKKPRCQLRLVVSR